MDEMDIYGYDDDQEFFFKGPFDSCSWEADRIVELEVYI